MDKEVPKFRHIEMIDEYIMADRGWDLEYFDNHGTLIRCKDCKYYHMELDEKLQWYLKDYWCVLSETKENDFCSRGEREES